MEINTGAANCPPRDGAGPTCTAPSNTTRWFLRFSGAGWEVIAGSRRAGCTDVQVREPAFPARLCADLGPVG
ncbi:hypothetical protein ACNTMW_09255 [Planosporangium sp. 12N6]|uniref:hypothetical protein n=1 Tax=Planosporangium spinosum TaxID=3402278 RepID=UPI003CE9752C